MMKMLLQTIFKKLPFHVMCARNDTTKETILFQENRELIASTKVMTMAIVMTMEIT